MGAWDAALGRALEAWRELVRDPGAIPDGPTAGAIVGAAAALLPYVVAELRADGPEGQ